MEIKQSHAKLVLYTENQLAPIVMQDARDRLHQIKVLWGNSVDKKWVKRLRERITVEFTDKELEEIMSNPAFMMALMELLEGSLDRLINGKV